MQQGAVAAPIASHIELNMQLSQSLQSGSHQGGAHTQFKEALKADLHKKVSKTVTERAGPSWDERMEKAVKGFRAKASASENEMKKNLAEAIEKGRSRKTSAPIRSASETPNQNAMLQKRKKEMHDLELQYREQLDNLRDKMEKREPLFRLSEVNAAFAMQHQRMQERKRQMIQDEHERWEHLRSVEHNASSRPLLIQDPTYKPPRKPTSASSPQKSTSGEEAAQKAMSMSTPAIFGGREEYEKDIKIREAVSTKWFQNTPWAKEVREIKERADNRKKLHEIQYPNKGDRHALTRNRLMHQLPAQVPAVY